VLSQSGPENSSSPGSGRGCSSEPKETPQKRPRQDDSVVDLTASEAKFVLPNCFGARGFFEKFPPDHTEVEDDIDVVDMLIRVRLPVVSPEQGRFLKSGRNGCPHNFAREGAATILVVTTMWRAMTRTIVARGRWVAMPV
ncbi:hypothetical protein A2U01_0048633, partial [Trifolium medium]|nr:hypothetical protein [Trifolium medium]